MVNAEGRYHSNDSGHMSVPAADTFVDKRLRNVFRGHLAF